MRAAAAVAAVLPWGGRQWRAAAEIPLPKPGIYCDDTHCAFPPFNDGISIEVWVKTDAGAFDFLDFITSTKQAVNCFDEKYTFNQTYGTMQIEGIRDTSTCIGKAVADQFNQSAEAVRLWYDGDVLSFHVQPYGVCVLRRQNIYDPSDQTCANFPQPPPAPRVTAPAPGWYCSAEPADGSAATCFGDAAAAAAVHLIDDVTYDLSLSGAAPWAADCKGERYTYSDASYKLALDLSDPTDCVARAARVNGTPLDVGMWWNGRTLELRTKTVGLCVLYESKAAC